MLKRTVRHLAVTGITIVSATMLTALGAAVASAAAPPGFESVNHDGPCLTAGYEAPAVRANCTFALPSL